MRKQFYLAIKISFTLVLLLSVTYQSADPQVLEHPRKIVVFKKWYVEEAKQDALLSSFGAARIKRLSLINGMAVHLPSQAEKALKEKREILRIDEDLVLTALLMDKGGGKLIPPQPPQELPWGLVMIGADLAWSITTGLEVKVAILDTGVDLNHPDLQDNIKGDLNIINPHKSGNDDNGHGTHVAGIVGAVDNDIGVIGAAPGIYLYAVKVLDNKGRGYLSDLICGLDWCINNEMDVVNMSFGSLSDNQSFHEAIIKAYQAGVIQIAAAGNNGEVDGAISYPARYPQTIAVSAVDQYDNFASFSSYGEEIDVSAPGVDIKSTYKEGTYQILSGTSMSAPYVTGAVALILTATPPRGYDSDGDRRWDPDEILMKIKYTAKDLGLDSFRQGAGLVWVDF